MIENIVADTSFLFMLYNDINKRDFLDIFLNTYSFHLGPKIFKELLQNFLNVSKFPSSTVF
jgi:aminoglycoside phosphotransferase family enzyme